MDAIVEADHGAKISDLTRSESIFSGINLRPPLVRLTREYDELSGSLFEYSRLVLYVPFDDGVVVQCGYEGLIRHGSSIRRFRSDSSLREATPWERSYRQQLDTDAISETRSQW
mgnify:CR=1 FL=1